jgi:hypothetical protein
MPFSQALQVTSVCIHCRAPLLLNIYEGQLSSVEGGMDENYRIEDLGNRAGGVRRTEGSQTDFSISVLRTARETISRGSIDNIGLYGSNVVWDTAEDREKTKDCDEIVTKLSEAMKREKKAHEEEVERLKKEIEELKEEIEELENEAGVGLEEEEEEEEEEGADTDVEIQEVKDVRIKKRKTYLFNFLIFYDFLKDDDDDDDGGGSKPAKVPRLMTAASTSVAVE